MDRNAGPLLSNSFGINNPHSCESVCSRSMTRDNKASTLAGLAVPANYTGFRELLK
jgi:hypothetical protein